VRGYGAVRVQCEKCTAGPADQDRLARLIYMCGKSSPDRETITFLFSARVTVMTSFATAN